MSRVMVAKERISMVGDRGGKLVFEPGERFFVANEAAAQRYIARGTAEFAAPATGAVGRPAHTTEATPSTFAAPAWIDELTGGGDRALEEVLSEIASALQLGEKPTKAQILKRVEELYEELSPKQLAVAIFRAGVDAARAGDQTLTHADAQQLMATRFPLLFAGTRTVTDHDVNRMVANGMLSATAQTYARRDGITIAEAQQRAATLHPEIATIRRTGRPGDPR